jgi:hypothetical protein
MSKLTSIESNLLMLYKATEPNIIKFMLYKDFVLRIYLYADSMMGEIYERDYLGADHLRKTIHCELTSIRKIAHCRKKLIRLTEKWIESSIIKEVMNS